jgi:inner membrane protease ATP23
MCCTVAFIGPSVIFMLKHLKLSGCPVPPSNVVCAPCDLTRSGGFHPAGAIVLCQGHFGDKKHMEDTLTHELVHMYDHCKFNVDWRNLRHHACSEVSEQCVVLRRSFVLTYAAAPKIRANSLSGDCRYMRELGRGFVSFSTQHQVYR